MVPGKDVATAGHSPGEVATVESDGHLGPMKEEGVASCTEKTSRRYRLRCRVERRVLTLLK
jgi:hypothetical protein